MKKVLFVLALVAAYGVSMAVSNAIDIQETEVVLVAEGDTKEGVTPEGEKTAVEAKAPAKAEGCSGTKTAAKAEGCSDTKTTAKADGCSDKKTASTEKSGCCSGSKKVAQK